MIRDSEEAKGRFGVGAYLISALKQINPEQAEFTLTLDGETRTVEGMGVMVANFGLANFRVPITGDVSPADGKLTVIVLKGGNLASLLPTLIGSVRAKLNLGDPDLGSNLERYEACEVTVRASKPLPAQYDGETLDGEVQEFRAKVLPGAVRYITATTMTDLTT